MDGVRSRLRMEAVHRERSPKGLAEGDHVNESVRTNPCKRIRRFCVSPDHSDRNHSDRKVRIVFSNRFR
jgi:capsid protein